MSPPVARDHVAALEKGLQVLTCFGRRHSRLTQSQVARLIGCTPASARRAMLTLQVLGYLESDGKRFWMTSRSLLVAHAYLTSRPAPALAPPFLDILSDRTRESASLGVLLDDDVVIVARSTARRSLSTGLAIGSRLPAYCSALGRMLLASMAPQEAEQCVRRMARPALTPRTVCEADAVLALVARCREDGYSCSDGELELGVRSMAVPVTDRAGAPVAAIGIAVRAEYMEMSEFRAAMLPPLQQAGIALSAQIYPEE